LTAAVMNGNNRPDYVPTVGFLERRAILQPSGPDMPGIVLVTNMDASGAAAIVRKAASRLDFQVKEVADGEMELRKGNLAASIVLGMVVAYCNFHVSIRRKRDDTVEITIDRNSPWWSGTIGVSRVKNKVKELADEIEDRLRDERANVLHRETF
jgi:hypothetical protein